MLMAEFCNVAFSGLAQLHFHASDVQVSAIVQKFYECLSRGDEYKDDCWEDWQNNHPADLAARGVPQGGAAGGGAGRGNCFK